MVRLGLALFGLAISSGVFAGEKPSPAQARQLIDQLVTSVGAVKTAGTFLKALAPKLSGSTQRYLSQKMGSGQDVAVSVKRETPTRIAIEVQGTPIRFEILEDGAYQINNQRYVYDENKSIEQIWKEVVDLLPRQFTQKGLWDWMVPDAQASPLLLVAGAVFVGLGFWEHNERNCKQVLNSWGMCLDYRAKHTRVLSVQDILNATYAIRLSLTLGCEDKKDSLAQCLRDLKMYLFPNIYNTLPDSAKEALGSGSAK